MSPHKAWCQIVLVVVGVLTLAGLPRLGPALIMIGAFTASSVVSARFAWVWLRDGQAKTGWDAWSEAWRVAAVALVAVLVLNGLHALFGSAALPIGFAAAFAALVALSVLRRTPHASGGRGAAPPASAPRRRPAAPAMPPTLPTAALCWEWRRSYVAVVRASKPDELTRIVALRAAYLDELERRDPTGFRRWLADGARAASDPGRYLTSG